MNIALENKSASFCREAFRQTKLIQEHAECIVSDVLEDVGQIASAEAQICLKSKELIDHGVQIGAASEISVFYITEGRERVRCMRLSKPIEFEFDCPALSSDAFVQVTLSCQGVQARAVNPRKIAVQITVRADLNCWAEDSLSIPFGVSEPSEGLQLRQQNTQSVMTVQLGEKSFVISEQIPLDADEEPCAIVCARSELLCTDHQIIGSKALIKGGAQLRIGYETQDGALPRFTEQCLPFSVLVDMPDESCALGSVLLQTTALYAELSDAINNSRVIELELHAVAQFSFEKCESIDYLSDAYCTRCPVIAGEEEASLCRKSAAERLHAGTIEHIQVEEERGLVAASAADILSYAVKDGKAVLSASVSLLLCAENGSFSALQRLVSMETPMPEGEGELVDARIIALKAERQGEEIMLNLSCETDCILTDKNAIRYISSLELDTENAYDSAAMPSLTLAKKAGRELWEIAKLYNSSVEAIGALNDKYTLPGDLLLIPRV